MMELFTRLFGDYPFGRYTVVVTEDDLEIPLESQSLSTFGANFLVTDWDAERLIAHEMSHQWFGNSLTLGEWQRHLAARGLRLLLRVAVVRGVRRGLRARARACTTGRAGSPSRPGPRARRPGPGADVRRPRLQARGADSARAAADRGRRRLLRRSCTRGRPGTRTAPSRPRCSSASSSTARARTSRRCSRAGSARKLFRSCPTRPDRDLVGRSARSRTRRSRRSRGPASARSAAVGVPSTRAAGPVGRRRSP